MSENTGDHFLKNADAFTLESLEAMRKKLLDLTSRNRLLNFPITQKGSTLRIIDEIPDQLCAELLADKELRFRSVPHPTREQLLENGYIAIDENTGEEKKLKSDPDAKEWAGVLGFDTDYALPRTANGTDEEKHQDDAIQVLLFPPAMETRLRTIRNKAQTAIEETGASILYLALGFLEWFESENSGKPRLAPLFTIPVQLNKGRLNNQTGTYDYTLKYTGEDILTNLSLREKLSLDFGLALPDIEDEVAPETYLNAVDDLIKRNNSPWQVRRYGALALLNFGKMLMYLDLDPERWPAGDGNIVNHPVVNRFFKSEGIGPDNGGGSSSSEHVIDDIDRIHDRFPLIDDADSSQHSALIDAINGQNLVIEGPPGTGKSQTITNLIAAAMLQGKKVLFVAEKMAALNVVKKRLDKAGLGLFCLELHSHKSQKRKVLDEINTRVINQHNLRSPRVIDAEVARYEKLKTELNGYAQEINSVWGNTGKTIHEILSGATRYRQQLNLDAAELRVEGLTGEDFTDIRHLEFKDQAKEFQEVYRETRNQLGERASIDEHPWFGVENTAIQIFESGGVTAALAAWQSELERLLEQNRALAATLSVDITALAAFSACQAIAEDLKNLPELVGNECLNAVKHLDPANAEKTENQLGTFENIQDLYKELQQFIEPQRLKDLSNQNSPPMFANISEQIGANQSENLTSIIQSAIQFKKIRDELESLYKNLSELKDALPIPLAEEINPNVQGLQSGAQIIGLVSKIRPEQVELRSNHLDSERFDESITELQSRLDILLPMRDRVSKTYRLVDIPDHQDLLQIKNQLTRRGAGKWFTGNWWRARKDLKSIASSPNVKLRNQKKELDTVILYSDELYKLATVDYATSIGPLFKHLDTDVEQLKQLRSWYRDIRDAYGFGFGQKVAIGDGILALDANTIRGIHHLERSGTTKSIAAVLENLDQATKKVSAPRKELYGPENLIGDAGTLQSQYALLSASLEPLQEWLINTDISLEKTQWIISQVHELHGMQEKFSDNNAIKSAFSDAVKLNFGLGEDNTRAVASVRATLEFATHIHSKLRFKPLSDAVLAIETSSQYSELKSNGHPYRELWDAQKSALAKFENETALDLDKWMRQTDTTTQGLISRNEKAISRPEWLNGWVNYIRIRNEMEASGLGRIWTQVNSGQLDVDQTQNAMHLAIFDQLAREILTHKPRLAQFSGRNQTARQNTFRKYDHKLKQLQQERIASVVAEHNAPSGRAGGRKSEYTEMALLKNELSKKTRHIPIRQLINRASQTLIELKPCFMMGPMSAAHYLRPGQLEFDLVVMDEASQVKPEDALGVIARGKQLIVVGDPKQLPPTSFFDRQDMIEDEDSAAIAQTDSILDAALPLFKMRRLRWHYRSQHQSLIAFSNKNFYDNDLVVFPSPHAKADGFGVKFTYVEGGRFVNQYNVEEARIVAKAAAEHALNCQDESLGIVAMSSKQREQIERALEEECKADPIVADAIEQLRSRDEDLFIKNLENVQGDERDVIYISFTYGPGEVGGRVFQRFGPINSDVGWRRLNVLFTRSKKRMHAFSSMRAEHVEISPTSKRGVQALKNFLHYAEKGQMGGAAIHTGKPPDSDFEVAVIDALHIQGFACEAQVGVAGFFIDIAVIDPGRPGRFLMGIECDGATYHSAKSARDRDRLRQEVLEGLGWNIRRIWSTDWFSNPMGELDPIIRELHRLKTEPAYDQQSEKEEEPQYAYTPAIVEIGKEQELSEMVNQTGSLKIQLEGLADSLIASTFPDTPKDERFLRPAMIEALLEHEPVSRSEFTEKIPYYLRNATNKKEAISFLDQVLDIIAGVEQPEVLEKDHEVNTASNVLFQI